MTPQTTATSVRFGVSAEGLTRYWSLTLGTERSNQITARSGALLKMTGLFPHSSVEKDPFSARRPNCRWITARSGMRSRTSGGRLGERHERLGHERQEWADGQT